MQIWFLFYLNNKTKLKSLVRFKRSILYQLIYMLRWWCWCLRYPLSKVWLLIFCRLFEHLLYWIPFDFFIIMREMVILCFVCECVLVFFRFFFSNKTLFNDFTYSDWEWIECIPFEAAHNTMYTNTQIMRRALQNEVKKKIIIWKLNSCLYVRNQKDNICQFFMRKSQSKTLSWKIIEKKNNRFLSFFHYS